MTQSASLNIYLHELQEITANEAPIQLYLNQSFSRKKFNGVMVQLLFETQSYVIKSQWPL